MFLLFYNDFLYGNNYNSTFNAYLPPKMSSAWVAMLSKSRPPGKKKHE
jgi:hypothetical protein